MDLRPYNKPYRRSKRHPKGTLVVTRQYRIRRANDGGFVLAFKFPIDRYLEAKPTMAWIAQGYFYTYQGAKATADELLQPGSG